MASYLSRLALRGAGMAPGVASSARYAASDASFQSGGNAAALDADALPHPVHVPSAPAPQTVQRAPQPNVGSPAPTAAAVGSTVGATAVSAVPTPPAQSSAEGHVPVAPWSSPVAAMPDSQPTANLPTRPMVEPTASVAMPVHVTDRGVLSGTPLQQIPRPTFTDLVSATVTAQPAGEEVGTPVQAADAGTRSVAEFAPMPVRGPQHSPASMASELSRVVQRNDEQTGSSPMAAVLPAMARADPTQTRTEGHGGRIIHVHIGSIEVQPSPTPAAPAPAPAPAAYMPAAGQASSAGFEQHHRLRSYASWES